jgi:uncharacterized protein (DUF1778 family)
MAVNRARQRAPQGRTGRTETINLRATALQRTLIDRAADTLGKNRSDFMLDAACRQANAVLLDKRMFVLDTAAYRRFAAALDESPTNNPRLRRLLATPAPWE